jgi:bifunctional DNase/RNase
MSHEGAFFFLTVHITKNITANRIAAIPAHSKYFAKIVNVPIPYAAPAIGNAQHIAQKAIPAKPKFFE